MEDMYHRGQPLSEILNADYEEMRMCYQWSVNIADNKVAAIKKAKAAAGIK